MAAKDGISDKLPLNDERSMVLLRRLVRESVRPYTLQLVFAVIAMVLVAGTQALTAWLMDPVVNKVFVQKDEQMLWLVGGAVLVTFLVKSIASYAQETFMAYVGHRVVADTQSRLFAGLLNQDVGLFQAHQTGTLLSRFSYDVERMRFAVSNALLGVGRDALTVIFLVGVMFYQQWMLATVALVAAPVTVVPIHRLGQRIRKVTADTQHEMGQLTTTLSQSFHGIRMVKAYRMEAYERAKADGFVESIFTLAFRAARVRAAAQPIIDAFGGVAITAVVVYGGHRVVQGATTPGAFFSFITALMMAYQPMRALGKVNAIIQEGLASAQRVFNLVDRVPAIREPENPAPVPRQAGPVRFDGVSFSYDDETDALDGVTFEAVASIERSF